MGQEIENSQFTDEDFVEFRRRLARETDLLASWLQEGRFSEQGGVGGYELEAWLVDEDGRPDPRNQDLLARLDSPVVVPELARFNVELNAAPHRLEGDALSRMHAELSATWRRCGEIASDMGTRLASIGILPTVRERDLSLANMSPLKRYRALNDQVFRLRGGAPVHVHIRGAQPLDLMHSDVMLESAATSFQIHLKVAAREAVAFYNASKMISAPMVAVAANSPFLFGHELWEETRIPLFQQAVAVGGTPYSGRVSFGVGYAASSIFECYTANRDRYPVLLPWLTGEDEESLSHLRLHNGTIWRWNRPLIGFDSRGRPHLRIEHRVIPAGPTLVDMTANAAFYFGAVTFLAREIGGDAERRLPFVDSRDNFYAVARRGLPSQVFWLDGISGTAGDLVLNVLLPQAAAGLQNLGIDESDATRWLDIIRRRVESGRTGAWWQREWVQHHGADMQALVDAYLIRQETDVPVHEWTLSH